MREARVKDDVAALVQRAEVNLETLDGTEFCWGSDSQLR